MKRRSKDFGLQQLQPFSYEICEPHMMTEEKTVPRTATCLELLLLFFAFFFLLFSVIYKIVGREHFLLTINKQ